MIRRRDLIVGIGGAAVAWPVAARAQRAAMPVIGYLSLAPAGITDRNVTAFREGLRAGGYVEDQNVAIEYRYAEGHSDRLPALANELVDRQVKVIVATGGIGPAQAAKAATSTIPIIFYGGGADVVKSGLVASYNRPGGNVTGITTFTVQLFSKQLELLHRLVPDAPLIEVLVNPAVPALLPDAAGLENAARANGVELLLSNANGVDEMDVAFAATASKRGALVVSGAFFDFGEIVTLSKRHAVPTIYPWREFPAAGGLMSYGNDLNEGFRQAGAYTARVLKGEKPSDLPVMQPTKFQFVINTTTTKALGLTIPLNLLALADEVIE